MFWNRSPAMRTEGASIRHRLLWHLIIVFACGMVALYWGASSYARLAADSSFDRLLLGSATSIAETLSVSSTGEVSGDIPYAALDMLSAAPNDRVFYRIVGPDGGTLTGYADLPFGQAADPRGLASAQPRFFAADYKNEPVQFVVLGRQIRVGRQSGWVWVQVGQTREARRQLASELTIRALLPIAVLTLLAISVVWVSVGRAVRPLEAIGHGLAARKASDLSPISATVPDEIAPLVQAINQFMGRLGNNMGVLRTFIADAAHQLRTPLTALIVQLRSAELSSGKARADSLGAAGQSANRLARLVDQLLSDAMVTHRIEVQRQAPFDLRKVVEHTLLTALPLADDADVRFTTRLETAMLLGDQVMVAEALKNLSTMP
jgi:two-component system, OmpR family, sensor histidine kinase TctE